MLFNSLEYLVFLPIVFLLYWLLPHKFRWILLLLSGYYFYMSWNVEYVLLILLTTAVSYFCALLLEVTESKTLKKLYLSGALLLCLSVLFLFKYFNFVSETVVEFCQMIAIPIHPVMVKLLLPVGISFYTFQSLAYVIDVYRGEVKAEKHFGIYAAFISFFPQLVAGPIERSRNLLPQIASKKEFIYDEAVYGLRQMLLGFAKKMLIADVAAKYVDIVFSNVIGMQGLSLMLGAFLFTFQIYCDFSGYSDIAIGTARLFGIKLMINFKSPYLSHSIKEFWSRWHISLSGWFRDYLYIPLGGNRVKTWRIRCNLLITFLASGLWHGAAWTFIAWGGIHGILRVGEEMISLPKKSSVKRSTGIGVLQIMITFVLVSGAWVFFRANSIWDAFYVLTHMWQGFSLAVTLGQLQMTAGVLFQLLACIALLIMYDYISMKKDILAEISMLKLPIRWAVYFSLTVLLAVLSLHTGGSQEFIYFQF